MGSAAELQLELATADGNRRPLHVIIKVPQPAPKQDWYCSVRLKGLTSGSHRIWGVDSWQALILAVRFVEANLRNLVRRGCSLYWMGHKVSVARIFANQ